MLVSKASGVVFVGWQYIPRPGILRYVGADKIHKHISVCVIEREGSGPEYVFGDHEVQLLDRLMEKLSVERPKLGEDLVQLSKKRCMEPGSKRRIVYFSDAASHADRRTREMKLEGRSYYYVENQAKVVAKDLFDVAQLRERDIRASCYSSCELLINKWLPPSL